MSLSVGHVLCFHQRSFIDLSVRRVHSVTKLNVSLLFPVGSLKAFVKLAEYYINLSKTNQQRDGRIKL